VSQVDASVSEARRWIDDWRRGAAQEGSSQAPSEGAIQGSSNDSSSSSNGSGLVEEEKDGGGPFAGFKWPWEQETIFVDDPSSQSQQQDRPKVWQPSATTFLLPQAYLSHVSHIPSRVSHISSRVSHNP
jgi:hypothetical protein